MSQVKLSSRVTEPNISLEQAVATILDHSVKEISAALKQASVEETTKLVVAVGSVWENKGED